MEKSAPPLAAPAQKATAAPEVVMLGASPEAAELVATAQLLGSRIDTRAMADDPAVVSLAGATGMICVFRFGAVVAIWPERAAPATDRIAAALLAHVVDPNPVHESEVVPLTIAAAAGDQISLQGRISLADASAARLQLVATVLARSVVLSRDETLVSEAFDRIAPLVSDLRLKGQVRLPIRPVMRLIGDVLSARHRVLATVQADERPDLLWDSPGLDRLYDRLEAEYELSERATALERKFDALGDFAEVLLDLVQDKRAFRLEAAIIALIAFELALSLFKTIFP